MKISNTILLAFFAGFSQAQLGIGATSPSEELDIESTDVTNTSIDINNTAVVTHSSIFKLGVLQHLH